MQDSLEYHLNELAVAQDASHQKHQMPPSKLHYKRILDIGCGTGQTIITKNYPPEVEAYGIDPDAASIEAGKRIAPPNVHLTVGTGEKIPFPDLFFDQVICRVALPYMHIATALSEIHRVLTRGGEAWFLLHPEEMYAKRVSKDLKTRNGKDLLYCSFIYLNSFLANTAGKQLTIKNRTETFQTEPGIRRALKHAGFTSTTVTHEAFFVAECQKPL
ncbi:MAG TPA: class I SAM-dependent methyltransferase [Granulicella sp.]